MGAGSLSGRVRAIAAPVSAAIPVWMLVLGAALPITLAVTESMGLPEDHTASWVMAFFGVSAVLGIVLSLYYRLPLVFTGHILALILFGTLGDDFSFEEMVGAAMVAGIVVAVLGLTGVTKWFTAWIPAPIVMAMIAGTVIPLVAEMFTALGTEPVVVGVTMVAFVASQRLLGTAIPPLVSALVVGLVVAGLTGRFGEPLPGLSLPEPIVFTPEFSLEAIVATLPVLVVLVVLQGMVPSVIYLREQGYDPPERALNAISGGSSLLGSLFGPMAVTIPVPPLAMIGGPAAGPEEKRYIPAAISSILPLLVAVFATTAAPLGRFLPAELIFTVAGLALVNVLTESVADMVRGPLRIGPVVTFAVILSDISLLGLGPFFWSLVAGVGFSLLLEREGWREFRAASS